MKHPLHKLIFCCLVLASLPPSRPLDETPVVLSQGTPVVEWSTLRTQLEAREDFYRYASQLPPPTTAPKKPATVAPSGFSGDVWWALSGCESGHQNASTGNGFYGYFQFVPSTWHSLGYGGLPTDFDYETQRAAAMQLQARSGWSQWPSCSRQLGLR